VTPLAAVSVLGMVSVLATFTVYSLYRLLTAPLGLWAKEDEAEETMRRVRQRRGD
jgi:hypothetical protein